jgi:hypothetical protein
MKDLNLNYSHYKFAFELIWREVKENRWGRLILGRCGVGQSE